MSNTLTNFLVGIGFDVDKKSQKKVNSGLDSIKSKALQIGAVLAGAFGAKALTKDTANMVDDLAKVSEILDVNANSILALGQAADKEGGSMQEIISELLNLDKIRRGIAKGEAGIFGDLGISGGDASEIINAENAVEAYLLVADQIKGAGRVGGLNIAESLGLGHASFRLLSEGEEQLRKIIDAESKLRSLSPELVDSSKEFRDAWADTRTHISRIALEISTKILPPLNTMIEGLNFFLGTFNTGFLDKTLGETFGFGGGGEAMAGGASFADSGARGGDSSALDYVANEIGKTKISDFLLNPIKVFSGGHQEGSTNTLFQERTKLSDSQRERLQNINIKATFKVGARELGDVVVENIETNNTKTLSEIETSNGG